MINSSKRLFNMPHIQFLNLKLAYEELKEEISNSINEVLLSGWYIGGEKLEAFEENFSQHSGSKYAVGVANGLDALTLSLRALNVSQGDEVIVPSNTYIATWLAVSEVGATPVPVEPDEKTYNISIENIKKLVTNKTKAILPVHLYGHPVDSEPIENFVKDKNISLVFDAAQAHGSLYKGSPIGGIGDATAWSFYPGKNLGAFGDAGAITTNDLSLANQLRALRNYGSHKKYVNDIMGYNSRLDPLQAAALDIKLKYLNEWTSRRLKIANRYSSEISRKYLKTPATEDWAKHGWHLYVIRTKYRDEIISYLNEKKIETIIHYPIPPHKQKAYNKKYKNVGKLMVAESMSNEVLSIPIGPHLKEKEVDYIIDSLNQFVPKN